MRSHFVNGAILQPRANAARTASSKAVRFITGSDPGSPRQVGQTCVFGGAPNVVEQPQKSLVRVCSWTWTSRPMTVVKGAAAVGVAVTGALVRDFGRRAWPTSGTPGDGGTAAVPVGEVLVAVGGPEEERFGEGRGLELEADRQASLGESAGERDPSDAGEVRADGVKIDEVHRQRIAALLAELEGRRRRHRPTDQIDLLEGVEIILADEAADLQCLGVVGVVVAGGEGIGAKHDPALHLGTEALGPAAAVHLDERRLESAT